MRSSSAPARSCCTVSGDMRSMCAASTTFGMAIVLFCDCRDRVLAWDSKTASRCGVENQRRVIIEMAEDFDDELRRSLCVERAGSDEYGVCTPEQFGTTTELRLIDLAVAAFDADDSRLRYGGCDGARNGVRCDDLQLSRVRPVRRQSRREWPHRASPPSSQSSRRCRARPSSWPCPVSGVDARQACTDRRRRQRGATARSDSWVTGAFSAASGSVEPHCCNAIVSLAGSKVKAVSAQFASSAGHGSGRAGPPRADARGRIGTSGSRPHVRRQEALPWVFAERLSMVLRKRVRRRRTSSHRRAAGSRTCRAVAWLPLGPEAAVTMPA